VRSTHLAFLVVLTSVTLILTALGFFVRVDTLLSVQWILVTWAAIIAAFTVILGFLNVMAVHIGKLASRAEGWPYSLVLIITAVSVLAIGLGELIFDEQAGLWGPVMEQVFVWIVVPLEAAAAALLPFILTYAAYRMLRMDRRKGALIFLISALIIVVGQLPLQVISEDLRDLRAFWLAWLAIPGLRAVLIGVALGISMTVLRLGLGVDRPQS
jgi:hypothetical protein